jgi:hypothetical protein
MELGTIINDQYTVVEHIGRGGMADVWSARDQRLRRMVAIKTIAVGLTQDIDPVSLFRKEAETIAQMEHPNILPIYDFGEHSGNLYIVMRFVTGGSLEDLLEQNPISLMDTLRIADAIAQALDYAHTNKIIHLDLKPPNILMDSSGAPYLADFGLATVLDPEGRARNPGSGTLLYMAPEQLTSEVIDHRADIYSFGIMLFHMLTGKLPFDGTMPLALRQMQYGDELPIIEDMLTYLPSGLSEILRRATAKDPNHRPQKLAEIVEDIRNIAQPQGSIVGELTDTSELMLVNAVNLETGRLVGLGDPNLLEAVDIYTRARHNWAGGQGRFLVSLTHFLIMSEYYQDALRYGLTVDEAGHQMLLRGALEYDHEVAYWWDKLNEDSHRWVCLHTIRSGTTPARIRALYRLESLADDEKNAVIPKLVAQALEIERDPQARVAALQVLATRAKLMKHTSSYQIKTEYRGRLITTMTRIGIEVAPPSLWQEAVYSPEIDLMIAEQALDVDTPQVAHFAARAVGKMRSMTGVRHLANEQRNKRVGALQALALVRDEAPQLPKEVSPQARAYAWMTNTLRRITDKPLDLVWRIAIILLFSWLAFGNQIYSTTFTAALVSNTRWGNTIASGLTMGVAFTLIILLTDEFPRRLKGFWTWWLRLVVGFALGASMGTVAWAFIRWFYFGENPSWDLMRLAGMSVAIGFLLVALFDLKRWLAFVIPVALFYLPSLIAVNNECLQDYSCYNADNSLFMPAFNYFPVAGVGLLIGVLLGWFIPRWQAMRLTKTQAYGGAVALASAWLAVVWLTYTATYANDYVTWDMISVWFLGSLLFALVVAYYVPRDAYVLFGGLALAVFGGLLFISVQSINQTLSAIGVDYFNPVAFVAPQKELGEGGDRGYLLWFIQGNIGQVFTVWIPTGIVLALAAYVQPIYQNITRWIGTPKTLHDGRSIGFTTFLLYVMGVSALVSVLALHSVYVSLVYGVGWSLWGFATFVSALATWQWARWGARSLFVLGILVVGGGVLYDAMIVNQWLAKGAFPPLFETQTLLQWGIWAVLVGIGALGALRRQLWGGIILASLVVAWYPLTFFGFLPASTTVQALANVALLAFTISPFMAEMEANRWLPILRRQPKLVQSAPSVAPKVPLTTIPVAMDAPKVDDTAKPLAPVTLPVAMDAPKVDDTAKPLPPVTLPVAMDAPKTPELITDRDPASHISDDKPSLPTEMDISVKKSSFKIDTRSLKAKSGDTDKPRLKFDMSALGKSKTEPVKPPTPDMKTELDASASNPSSATTPDILKPRKTGLKFDMSALNKSKTEVAKPSEPANPDMKTELDASASNPSSATTPDILKPRKTGLKFDMSALHKSKTEVAKPPTTAQDGDEAQDGDTPKDNPKTEE